MSSKYDLIRELEIAKKELKREKEISKFYRNKCLKLENKLKDIKSKYSFIKRIQEDDLR